MRSRTHKGRLLLLGALSLLVVACVMQGPGSGELHRWWAGFGPVLPHDTFPADCQLCHEGEKWNKLKPNSKFDHKAKVTKRANIVPATA